MKLWCKKIWKGAWVVVAVVGVGALSFWLRTFPYEQVFLNNTVAYADGDCYLWLQRAQASREHFGRGLHQHSFENHPEGTSPHTTLVFDHVLVVFDWMLGGFAPEQYDRLAWSAAWVGPVLQSFFLMLLTAALLRWGWPGSWLWPVLLAVSPPVVWTGVLGRPDHQALLVSLLFAVGAIRVAKLSVVRRQAWWGGLEGAVWGVLIWTSLLEPVLSGAILALGWFLGRKIFKFKGEKQKHWWVAWLVAGLVLLVALQREGVRLTLPGSDPWFAIWARQLGELQPSSLLGFLVALGYLPLLVLTVLIAARWLGRPEHLRQSSALLWLLSSLCLGCVLLILAWQQQRWMPYAVVWLAPALSWGLGRLAGSRWQVGVVAAALLCLWPMGKEWYGLKRPSLERESRMAWQAYQHQELAAVARALRDQTSDGDLPRGLMTPFWWAPAWAWHTGKPAVAGTSHQSLSGIVDSLRFFASEDEAEAAEYLFARQVRWVIVGLDQEMVQSSEAFFEQTLSEHAMARILWNKPQILPIFLMTVHQGQAWRVYEVDFEALAWIRNQ
ncbi:MAG: hypothetical protein ACFCU3_00135 [Verrucomicrobiales bacterium]